MTTLLAINPDSRSGEALPEGLVEPFEPLGPVHVVKLDHEGALDEALRDLKDSVERIVLGGGDGTINHALPTLRKAGLPLGILPLGTANDFARSLELPLDPVQAAEVIAEGRTRTVDIGEANGYPFLNAAGIGLGPELTKAMDSQSKRWLGVAAYFKGFFDVYRRFHRAAVLTIDGRRRRTRYMQITIANGVHYGGGLTVSRRARLDDGQLKVLCLHPQSFWRLLSKAVALRRGPAPKEERRPGMRVFSAKEVGVRTRTPADVTADGELITKTPLTCRVIPAALQVFVARSESLQDDRDSDAADTAQALTGVA